MRTLMMIASIAMIGAGIFCVANASAAFLSVAFIIGIVFTLLGAFEILVGRRADFDVSETGVGIAKDGVLMLFFGIVVLSGQITDDNSAQMMFALWMLVEGVLAFRSEWLDVMESNAGQRIGVALSTLMLIVGGYMFFNNSTLRLSQTLMIGICMIILGLRRFSQSFSIEYSKPSFVTGNEEKLREAQEDEKRALAKAKEGIREQKNAQRRIQKIREDIETERDIMNSAALRKAEREYEAEEDK
jgi:uncharacterized membrane protein HdeD (DUF308 family)